MPCVGDKEVCEGEDARVTKCLCERLCARRCLTSARTEKEYYQNLSMDPVNNESSQVFAQNQQYLRQQQALNQGFIGYDFRSWAGNR